MSDFRLQPDEVYPIGPSDREWSLILASALAWAVGKLEGMEVETGYAGRVLARWEHPQLVVRAEDPDSGSEAS